MSTALQNSIWPNEDGNLGNIKVQIPDGVNVQWPGGDALVGNFVYENGKLVGLVDTKALIVNDSGSTTINYDYVNIELPFAEDAMTINRGPRNKYFYITFTENVVEGINGDYMFANMETTNLFEFTPLTDEEIDSVFLNEYSSANHMFTGRLIQSPQQLTKLLELVNISFSPDESVDPSPIIIPSDTCLGIIFGGNIMDPESGSSFNGSIAGNYYLHDEQRVTILDGIADIEIENKIYHYDSNYDSSGTLYMMKISPYYEYNPYFILIYGKQLLPPVPPIPPPY